MNEEVKKQLIGLVFDKVVNWLTTCATSCGVRVNGIIVAAMPAIDYASHIFPQLKEYLPDNIYGYGFVALAIANTIMHFRTNATTQPIPPYEMEPKQVFPNEISSASSSMPKPKPTDPPQ